MKLIRFLITCLATVAALAAFVAAAAFLPPFQTWFARTELDDQPQLRASLGSLWAKFGKVDVEDLKMDIGDAIVTVPSLQVRLPVIDSIWHRRLLVNGLVAKGWTLDLSRLPEAAQERAMAALEEESSAGGQAGNAAPARAAAPAFGGILSGWTLPVDVSLDGVDLEGEILVSLFPGKAPVRVHVTIAGGGLAAGREGSFAVDAQTESGATGAAGAAAVHGRLSVAMKTPRSVDRVGIAAEVSAESGLLQEALSITADAKGDRDAGLESYTLDLARGSRHLAAIRADFHESTHRFDGTWKADLRESDLAPFIPNHPLPPTAAAGNGSFDADFTRVHLLGRLNAVCGGLGALAPSLGRVGRLVIAARFDVEHSGRSIRVNRLDASLAGDRPVALVQVLQPFDLDESTGDVKAHDPGSDWLDVSLEGFPLSWLPALPGGLAFDGGIASGDYLIRAGAGGYVLHQKAPLTARGASVRSAEGIAGSGLDLSLSMTAELDAKHLEVRWSPLSIDSAGRRLASLEAKGSLPAEGNQPMAVAGTLTADLEALASQPNLPALRWLPGRSATFDFTGNLGSTPDVEGNLSVVGRDPARTVTATVNADMDASGALEFLVPLKMTLGTGVSNVSAEGSWGRQKMDPRTELKLTSDNVALDQLLIMARPLAAVAGAPMRASASGGGPGARGRIPFWGKWVGSLTVSFDRLRTGDQDFTHVGGSFDIDHGSIQLEGGHGELPPNSLASVDGTISFDPDAERPYSLTGKLAPVANLDSALLLPAQPGQDPMIEGHFTLAGSVTGSGTSLGDLIAHTQEEFQLSSTTGIMRLLATDVADAIPEAKEPVSDSLDTVGDFVGSVLLGIKGHSIDPSKNKVSKTAEAVLNFTNQVSEIGFDKVTVTAVRQPDRSFRLLDLEMISPDAHLKGTGQITYSRGLPVSGEPLSLVLQLGVKDVSAKLLSKVGLLSPDKDGLGYSLLNQPVRFGGSLAHIDDKQWHDLLAKAATQKPPEPAKRE